MKLLDKKVCLVTGSNRGIGAEIARRFAEEGAIVYTTARIKGSIDTSCKEIGEKYATEMIPLYFDVRDGAEAENAIRLIYKQHGRLDVLANNAGIMRDALIGMISQPLMEEIFSVNVFAVINMIQLANKLMSRQKNGSIINFSSIMGVKGCSEAVVYSASKGAVIALTKAAAKELAPNHIRVNAIAPGMIDTDMFRSAGEEKKNNYLRCIKMGRLGTPLDVADAAVFLASDLSSYITGQILGVDGGAVI